MAAAKPSTPSKALDANRTVQIDRCDLDQRSFKPTKTHFLLVCIEGLEIGKTLELLSPETIIGRASNAALLLAHPQISRQHARLLWVEDHHEIEDLNSGNGTFVGGIRVAARHRLYPGDVIQFGTSFAFRYSVTDETEMALMQQLYQSSVLDALTGAYNREYFNKAIVAEMRQANATKSELALLLLDLDHFKRINDSFGHPAGDAVLIEFVNRVRLRLRSSDLLCRYGGEEFAIILRTTALEVAGELAERIRRAVAVQKFVHAGTALAVTVSIGCVSLACGGSEMTAEMLIDRADRRLYAAKGMGRNRVVCSDEGTPGARS